VKDEPFRALMNLVMASDPSPVEADEDGEITKLLDGEARKRGYDNWIVAFHEFKLPDRVRYVDPVSKREIVLELPHEAHGLIPPPTIELWRPNVGQETFQYAGD
jgi:hypothetical protein